MRTYGFLIALISPFYPKARQLYTGRKQQYPKIKSTVDNWGSSKIIWLHAASYGEYEMAKPIIDKLKKEKEFKFVISFHSPSGFAHTELEDPRFLKIYLPLDTRRDQAKMLDLIKPSKVIFIKYEFWFNLLTELGQRKIPYYYTSLHLNPNSYLFKSPFRPFLSLLKKSKIIYCHNENSNKILDDNGFGNTEVLGDTRVVQTLHNKAQNAYNFAWPTSKKKRIALGSIIPSEFAMCAQLINSKPDWSFLLAPHDIDKETITKLQSLLKEKVSLYSKEKKPQKDVVILDTIGDLRYLYKFCDVAYVGAGFEKGPHNVLEPLVYGLPTLCGPNIEKFPMAQFLASKAMLSIANRLEEVETKLIEMVEKDLSEFKSKTSQFFSAYPDNLDGLIKELCS